MAGDKREDAGDRAIGWGILGAVLFALAYMIWHFNKDAIRSAVRWIRYAEMSIVAPFVGDDYTVRYGKTPVNFEQWYGAIGKVPGSELDGPTMSVIGTLAMTPLQWVFAAIIVAIGFWGLFRGPGAHHRQTFNVDGLIRKQSNIFPIISPFIKFNPTNQPQRPPGSPVPAELPSFSEALGPEEWIAYNTIPVPDGKLDQEAAAKAFSAQLGQRWKGSKNLTPFKQIMLAAFCLKASRKRSDADVMLGRLAKCWSFEGGLQLGKDRGLLGDARKVLGNKSLAEKTLSKCNQHAWEATALLRALETAREEGGVLAPAQFVWLRGFDRPLWYPMNNLGRKSYHMEALGAMAHYKAEKLAQRPIPHPKVGDAVSTIAEYLVSQKSRPIPQLDYSNSKKRKGVKTVRAA